MFNAKKSGCISILVWWLMWVLFHLVIFNTFCNGLGILLMPFIFSRTLSMMKSMYWPQVLEHVFASTWLWEDLGSKLSANPFLPKQKQKQCGCKFKQNYWKSVCLSAPNIIMSNNMVEILTKRSGAEWLRTRTQFSYSDKNLYVTVYYQWQGWC